MTVTNDMILSYEKNLMQEEKAEATIKKYMHDVHAFADWLCGRDAEKCLLLTYKSLLEEKYKPTSVNSVIASLNNFFMYIGKYDLRMKTIKIQKGLFVSKEKELTKHEYERLLYAAKSNKRLHLLMQTICSTGIRVSELPSVTVESITAGEAKINCKGKIRKIFLPNLLCEKLSSYIAETGVSSGPVFVTKSGRPIDRSNIWSDMKKLCDSAGVSHKKVYPHNLRHLFACTYYSSQKDIVKLADILGHSNINTTRIYTMESGERHRRQLENLGLVQK